MVQQEKLRTSGSLIGQVALKYQNKTKRRLYIIMDNFFEEHGGVPCKWCRVDGLSGADAQ